MTGRSMRPSRAAAAAAGIGLAGAAAGWALAPAAFPHAWLAALVAWLGWPLGSMALLLAHALTGGRWGEALRAPLLAGVATIALLPVLVLPLLFVLPPLYPWARPGAALSNAAYLNLPFFAARGAAYLLCWIGLAAAILRGAALQRIAPAGLLLLAATSTFAALDLTMSLEPRFVSSAYGMLAAAGSGLLALAAAVLLAVLGGGAAAAVPYGVAPGGGPSGAVLDDVGKLLLALAMLWTYLDFMQLLIVWQSDLAAQAPWYAKRTGGVWGWAAGVVSLGHSVLPVALLLSPQVRRSARALACVAMLLAASELLRSWWLVLPAVPRPPGLLDLLCMLGVGGAGIATALAWTQRRVREHAHA